MQVNDYFGTHLLKHFDLWLKKYGLQVFTTTI